MRRRKTAEPPKKPMHVNESTQTDDEDARKAGIQHVAPRSKSKQKDAADRPLVSVRRSIVASRRFIFPLGLFLGILLTYIFFPPLPPHLSLLLEEYDLSFPFMTNVSFQFEWRQLAEPFLEGARTWTQNRDFKVGTEMKAKGLQARYPVVLVPGIVSTGLESWSTSPEYRHYFRKRLWGTTTMIRAVVTERDRWIAALMLDPETGLDPPGVKVRPAQGLDAASTFIPGYWIWSKVIENLACINYDTNNLELAAYDWRLSYYNMEVRDGYFSRLKSTVESFRKREGRKVVLVGHSMGSTIILYFLKWVEAPGFGDGGPDWVENHIEAFINVAGPLLGVPKAMTAFLSGEMKDTVEVNPAGSYVLEKFFSRKDRARLFRSWAGSASMFIKGGDAIWGNDTHAPDDLDNTNHTHGHFFSFRPQSQVQPSSIPPGHVVSAARPQQSMNETSADRRHGKKHARASHTMPSFSLFEPLIPASDTGSDVGNLTVEEASNWLLEHTPNSFQKMLFTNYSYGIELDEEQLIKNNGDFRKWTNPLEVQLPRAPSMKIYCLYGHGKDTERSYWYARGEYEHDEAFSDAMAPVCLNTTECDLEGMTPRAPLDMPLSRQNWIDSLVTRETDTPRVKNGVKIGEGDGTVPSLSLGAMCVEGWKRRRWNPAGINVTTYEMPHRPESLDIRGGATTSDHIDILGSQALNEIILKVAAGQAHDVEDHFVSDIRTYVQRIRWD